MPEPSVRLKISDRGVGLITIDVVDSKFNLLSAPLMIELNDILDQLKSQEKVKGVVFLSGKTDSFIAGADVFVIRRLQHSSPIEAYEASRQGKAVFDKIERLPIPTVAAINGTCFGGGTELTLACKYRLAADIPATSIGLPEVKLGFVPGWGATVRLPKLIGIQNALSLILTGNPVNAKKAWRLGVIDEYTEPDKLIARAEEIALGAQPRRYQTPLQQELINWLLESNPIGLSVIRDTAYKSVMRETKGKYPAPVEALKLVLKNATRSASEGNEEEAQVFARLAVGQISRNLVGIFAAQTESKKLPSRDGANGKINTVGVLGAGVMGAGIAQAAAYAGYKVVLKDVEQKFIDKGMANIQKLFDTLVKKHKISTSQCDQMLSSITPTVQYDQLKDCDLVIEAVLEEMKVKQEVLAELEKTVKKPFIFATNTSSLSVDHISESAANPAQTVGLHFFNPVHKMPLVEVVKGHKTSDETLALAKEFALKLGKTTVTTNDAPGFVVNRILAPYLREALVLLEEGVPPESMDKAMTSFGMPMGPFTLLDEVGLDIGAKVTHVLHEALGERMSPPSIMSKLDSLKLLGKKGGKGFYLYDENGKRTGFNPDILAAITVAPKIKMPGEIQDRLVLIMLNEAARCLEEKVIEAPSQLDLALIFGIGFPPFRGGILRYADQIGLKIVHQKLAFLSKVAGENYTPSHLILEMVADERTFYQD
jgi:3-hydroxyacyl-CoA dehydrogenase/enoyl-CoA hydratase/3-hydroxybutyryl-CoA epimerase